MTAISEVFDPPLDPGIERAVIVLRAAGVETFESCEGGPGHAYPVPTIRFHGEFLKGFYALSYACRRGPLVDELRRVWPVIDGEPTGPYWELTFRPARPTEIDDAVTDIQKRIDTEFGPGVAVASSPRFNPWIEDEEPESSPTETATDGTEGDPGVLTALENIRLASEVGHAECSERMAVLNRQLERARNKARRIATDGEG